MLDFLTELIPLAITIVVCNTLKFVITKFEKTIHHISFNEKGFDVSLSDAVEEKE